MLEVSILGDGREENHCGTAILPIDASSGAVMRRNGILIDPGFLAPKTLIYDLKRNANCIDTILISHDHLDHERGVGLFTSKLPAMSAGVRKRLDIFAPECGDERCTIDALIHLLRGETLLGKNLDINIHPLAVAGQVYVLPEIINVIYFDKDIQSIESLIDDDKKELIHTVHPFTDERIDILAYALEHMNPANKMDCVAYKVHNKKYVFKSNRLTERKLIAGRWVSSGLLRAFLAGQDNITVSLKLNQDKYIVALEGEQGFDNANKTTLNVNDFYSWRTTNVAYVLDCNDAHSQNVKSNILSAITDSQLIIIEAHHTLSDKTYNETHLSAETVNKLLKMSNVKASTIVLAHLSPNTIPEDIMRIVSDGVNARDIVIASNGLQYRVSETGAVLTNGN